ncbi:Odorant receptor 28 [Ephemera danica]|nr:Odorant receptor 28 [Ephemera danica]
MDDVVPKGLRVMFFCNKISGLWLQLPTASSKRLAVFCFEISIAAMLVCDVIFNIVHLFSAKNFVLFILSTSGILGMTHTTFSSIMLIINRRNINNIIKEAQHLIKLPTFRYHRSIILRRVSTKSIAYLMLPILGFVVAQINTIYFTSYNVLNPTTNVTSAEEQFIKDAMESSADSEMNSIIKILLFMNFLIQSLASFKLIAMDMLLLTLIYFVSEVLKVLRATLHDAMIVGPVLSFKKVDLNTWLYCQRRLSGFISRINVLWAPMIVVTILCNTLTICFLSYSIVKVYEIKIFMWIVFGFTMMTMLEVFIYCEAGHQLRTQGDAITATACQGPWLNMKPSLVPGIHLVALDCSRCFVLRGGPFFTLSLEFFASLVGAVFTYLVVLLQMK